MYLLYKLNFHNQFFYVVGKKKLRQTHVAYRISSIGIMFHISAHLIIMRYCKLANAIQMKMV